MVLFETLTKIVQDKFTHNGKIPVEKSYYNPLVVKSAFIHSSFYVYDNEYAKQFPIPYCNKYYFVGGYVYQDGSVSTQHTNILKQYIK